MNYIFDIGNVLVNFLPVQFLQTLCGDTEVVNALYETVFQSPEWTMLDADTISREDATQRFCSRKPEYRELIKDVMARIPEMLTPKTEIVELLSKIKAGGQKLYYLSNYQKDLHRYIYEKYAFFKLFDGGIFSCDVHLLKPNPEIYIRLMEEYSLRAVDCVFIDDTAANVETAEKLGMRGIVFREADDISRFLR